MTRKLRIAIASVKAALGLSRRKDLAVSVDESEAPNPYTREQAAEAEQRKQRSEARLQDERVAVNPHLPWIEVVETAAVRTREEVVRRLLGLVVVSARANGLPMEEIGSRLAVSDPEVYLTPEELDYARSGETEGRRTNQFSWRIEGAYVLAWAAGLIAELGRPEAACDVPALLEVVSGKGESGLGAEGRMRSGSELLDEADLIYRYHWAVRDAMINGKAPPAGLEPGVVAERHHALNWLIGYMDGAEWDEVTTDT